MHGGSPTAVAPERVPPLPPRTGRHVRPGRLQRARRIALVASVVSLLPCAISYVGAVTGPSNSSFGVRSVEWLRQNGAAGIVNKIENIYYSLTAPATGGPALRALPTVGANGGALRPRRIKAHFYRPPAIVPVIQPALRGEGVWHAVRAGEVRYDPILVTTFRPDPNYPRLVAGVAWVDTRRTLTRLYPGRQEPAVNIPRGAMDVPFASRTKLLATFNSGFRLADAGGGVALNGVTYSPMKTGDATFVAYRDGRVDILDWRGSRDVGPNVVFARQNLPLIVNGGRLNPNLSDGPEWGATLGNAIRVWRSAIGVTRHGDLLYAAANYQTVGSLARILQRAGAVRAMELDINSYWVTFISYGRSGARRPASLLSGMTRGAQRYLTPDDRDFFAIYGRR
jgi:hypothetical protein